MKLKLGELSRQYRAALGKHLKHGRPSSLRPAKSLGRQAMILGLGTLDLARIHQQTLVTFVTPGLRNGSQSPAFAQKLRQGRRSTSNSPGNLDKVARRAGAFFAEVLVPLEETHRNAREAAARLAQLHGALRQRGVDLSLSRRQLKQEIIRRKSAETSLKESEQHYRLLLGQSERMQEQLRFLSRQLLSAQEEERKKISRELHDVIAQTLTSINVQLGTLKKDATGNAKGLARSIARTQLLVEQSVDIVHRFARELRPTVLDDLGLIPALHTFMKSFRAETGIGVSLSAFAAVEQITGEKRTVLYRVAQEALTNIARHAQATKAAVQIQQMNGAICMKIIDNGKGFENERVLHAKKNRRLGLLGMRERLEMVGGNFSVTSLRGKGTTVLAQIPLMNVSGGGSKNRTALVR